MLANRNGIASDEAHGQGIKAVSVSGFSLVEVLIALVVVSLMSTMMVASIRQFRFLKMLETQIDEQAELDAITDFVASEIQKALKLPLLHLGGESSRPLIGSQQKIQFIAVLKTGFTTKKLVEAEYSIETTSIQSSLVRKIWNHRAPSDAPIPPVSENLKDNIKKISFRYLLQATGKDPVWTDQWLSVNKLPIAINISIESNQNKRATFSERTIVLSEGAEL
ncbi:prepilin-type N-terminal cleavage/methylation domain-containing protein [Rhizobium sp. PP-CC-3G-465]|uniref:prepilin-type N-terminal cleavage/methylation domain-containing protein n=1 Tax=Rhizobium sp. PP-CC-3G-465 TaxID=2135648 RepID=UPI00104F0F40|nr:prepilin-type N-terminal cleavage/methylation domain-containing protein [Rhizobium sp. PP-CC-3G-465]